MKGRYLVFSGPNGAGKSSTLEIIETLRPKTSGEVKVSGFDLDAEPEQIREDHRRAIAGFWVLPGIKIDRVDELFAGL